MAFRSIRGIRSIAAISLDALGKNGGAWRARGAPGFGVTLVCPRRNRGKTSGFVPQRNRPTRGVKRGKFQWQLKLDCLARPFKIGV
jgi:hypothetical protein